MDVGGVFPRHAGCPSYILKSLAENWADEQSAEVVKDSCTVTS